MEKLSSQKILLKDHFYFDKNALNEEPPSMPKMLTSKARKKTKRTNKSTTEKENINNSIGLNFMKVNSLAMAKKGSFKVSYLEDFTIEFGRQHYANSYQQQSNELQPKTMHIAQNLPANTQKMHILKKMLNCNTTALRSSYNEILPKIAKMKTDYSHNSVIPEYIKESANNMLLNQNTVVNNNSNHQNTVNANFPSTPSTINGISSNHDSRNHAYINSPQNLQLFDSNLMESDAIQFQQLIGRKKGRSLPPIKVKQMNCETPTQEQGQKSVQLSEQSNALKQKQKKRFSYLFDAYTHKVQDKVIESVDHPLILSTEPDQLTIDKIFKVNKTPSIKQEIQNKMKMGNNIVLEKKYLNKFSLTNVLKTSRNTNHNKIDISSRFANQHCQGLGLGLDTPQSKYADIQCISFKSYVSPKISHHLK